MYRNRLTAQCRDWRELNVFSCKGVKNTETSGKVIWAANDDVIVPDLGAVNNQ
jgi:hypothetical protein